MVYKRLLIVLFDYRELIVIINIGKQEEINMTVIQTISTIVGIVTGVLAIMGTISAATKKRRDKKKAELLREVIKPLTDSVESKIASVDKKVDGIEKKVNDNERDRLRGVILNLASRLRAGDIVTEEEYRDCVYCYDKYKMLGGNGQVREAFSLIEEHFHTVQMNEIHNNQENHN